MGRASARVFRSPSTSLRGRRAAGDRARSGPARRLPAVVGLAFAAIAAVLLPACASCRADPPLVVRKVLVDVEPQAAQAGGVDREAVRAQVAGILRERRGVKVDEASAEGAVLRVRVEAASRTSLALSLEVSGGGMAQGARYQYRGHSVAQQPSSQQPASQQPSAQPVGAAGASPTAALVAQSFEDALSQVLLARGADHEDSDVLLAWLAEPGDVSDDQRRQAIRILGARRDARAVPALSRILLGDDREMAQLALGALTLVGDPSAVEAVIEYSDGKPSLVRKQCIEAVRVMGTKLGIAWLFTLSTGHQDPEVQAAAAAALASLEPVDAAATRIAEQQQPAPEVRTP